MACSQRELCDTLITFLCLSPLADSSEAKERSYLPGRARTFPILGSICTSVVRERGKWRDTLSIFWADTSSGHYRGGRRIVPGALGVRAGTPLPGAQRPRHLSGGQARPDRVTCPGCIGYLSHPFEKWIACRCKCARSYHFSPQEMPFTQESKKYRFPLQQATTMKLTSEAKILSPRHMLHTHTMFRTKRGED
jgi:hypothetical protein